MTRHGLNINHKGIHRLQNLFIIVYFVIKYMLSEYKNLSWALTLNRELKRNLFETYKNRPQYLSYLDTLFFELRELKCRNIQENLKDVNTNLPKLSSIISELEIAKVLAKNGKEIRFLPDNFFDARSPDILAKDENFSTYIEVKRINEDEITFKIIDFLRDFLKNLPYRVDVKLKEKLSLPAMDYKRREDQETLVKTSIEQFEESFNKDGITGRSSRIETEGMIFKFHQTDSGRGYPGIINTECIQVPEDILKENVKYWLIKKAKKRDDWDGENRKYQYIIAIDCKEWAIDDITVNELLYGHRTSIGAHTKENEPLIEKMWEKIVKDKSKTIPKWKEIEEASTKGWRDLLLKEALIPNDYTYLTDEGIFLSEPAMENVSGVILKINDEIHFFPNPFASDEINNSLIINYIVESQIFFIPQKQ